MENLATKVLLIRVLTGVLVLYLAYYTTHWRTVLFIIGLLVVLLNAIIWIDHLFLARWRQTLMDRLVVVPTNLKNLSSYILGTRVTIVVVCLLLFAFYFLSLQRLLNAHNGITMFFVWEGID